MFGTSEIIVIALVVFVLFGAAAIPKFAKSLGQAKGEFDRVFSGRGGRPDRISLRDFNQSWLAAPKKGLFRPGFLWERQEVRSGILFSFNPPASPTLTNPPGGSSPLGEVDWSAGGFVLS